MVKLPAPASTLTPARSIARFKVDTAPILSLRARNIARVSNELAIRRDERAGAARARFNLSKIWGV